MFLLRVNLLASNMVHIRKLVHKRRKQNKEAVLEQLHDGGPGMRAKPGYRRQKGESPKIGNWLHRYVRKRTCRRWKRNGESTAGP
jgi:hypothetical protein